MKILKYFKTPFLKYFMKLLIFNINRLKTFKNMIKVGKFFASVSVAADNCKIPTIIEDCNIDSRLESVIFTRDRVLQLSLIHI